jgi:hypothetical protein
LALFFLSLLAGDVWPPDLDKQRSSANPDEGVAAVEVCLPRHGIADMRGFMCALGNKAKKAKKKQRHYLCWKVSKVRK